MDNLAKKALTLLTSDPLETRATTATDAYGSIFAVRIVNSIIGDYWLCLSDTEPFDPADGLPVYRPSEISALKGKGYGPEDLRTVHRLKTTFDGTVQ